DHLARVEVEGDDGVRHVGFRPRVIVAGRQVEALLLWVNRHRGPDADARRPEDAPPEFIFALFFRLLFVRVEAPNRLAGLGVDGRDAAAERAALVLGVAHHHDFFARRHADVDAPVVVDGRARADGHGVRINFHLPDLLPGL